MINAKDLRKKQGKRTINGKTLEDMIKSQNKSILRASENGCNSTCFSVHGTIYEGFEEEMVKYYKDLGYKIKPTGVVGGVMQETMDICW